MVQASKAFASPQVPQLSSSILLKMLKMDLLPLQTCPRSQRWWGFRGFWYNEPDDKVERGNTFAIKLSHLKFVFFQFVDNLESSIWAKPENAPSWAVHGHIGWLYHLPHSSTSSSFSSSSLSSPSSLLQPKDMDSLVHRPSHYQPTSPWITIITIGKPPSYWWSWSSWYFLSLPSDYLKKPPPFGRQDTGHLLCDLLAHGSTLPPPCDDHHINDHIDNDDNNCGDVDEGDDDFSPFRDILCWCECLALWPLCQRWQTPWEELRGWNFPTQPSSILKSSICIVSIEISHLHILHFQCHLQSDHLDIVDNSWSLWEHTQLLPAA